MSRISRKVFKSGFFHIMVQGINKEYIFKDKKDKSFYLFLMKKYYNKFKIQIVSYCIMDNHAHIILYTKNIEEISNYMHNLNLVYSKYYNTKMNRLGYVFRDRYKSQLIYDRDYLFKCMKYIHMNPVKAKIVKKEEDYEYSSYNEFINQTDFVTRFIINEVFIDKDYLKIFKKIKDTDVEIMDIDNTQENFKVAINKYLKHTGLQIKDIANANDEIYYFSKYLISKGFRKKQIAEVLSISQSKLSKLLKKTYPHNGNFQNRP